MDITVRVNQHLLSLGFPQQLVRPFVKRFSLWLRESGLEWTVERLKALRQYNLQLLSGSNPSIPAGWATRVNRKGKVIFADPLVHYVFSLASTGKNGKRRENFLRTYTVLVLNFRNGGASAKQIRKFYEGVTSQYSGSAEALEDGIKAVEKGLHILLGKIEPDRIAGVDFAPLRAWAPSGKRAPVIFRNRVGPSVLTPEINTVARSHAFSRDFRTLFTLDRDWQALWRLYPFDVSRCMVGAGEAIPIQTSLKADQRDVPLGRIGFIQEGGAKLRSVANPFLAVQALGEPLKQKLQELSRSIPVIGSFDQSACHNTIAQWVKFGREVHSYDLTSFTDRFPYVLQQRVLQLLCTWGYVSKFDVDVFDIVVKKCWQMPNSHPGYVRWEVGQPLGFGPSFPLASLTHAALVAGLGCRDFRIVGDDVAIAGSIGAKRYHDLITALGVEISASKSLVSREAAEFCGKLITLSGVTPSMKVRVTRGVDQFVEKARFYGTRVLNYLTSKSERQWALKVFLPDHVGGLGWSPPGIKYSEYLKALNINTLQSRRLRADLEEFLGRPYALVDQDLEWFSLFDNVNSLVVPVDRIGDGLSPKGMTGIAATNLLTHGRATREHSTAYRHKTWTAIVDDATRRYLAKHTDLPPAWHWLYKTKWGYFDDREKEPERLPISPIHTGDNDGRKSQTNHYRYFQNPRDFKKSFS